MTLLLLSACAPAGKSEEELRQQVQALKAQMAAVQEQLNQVQADQQAILALLKKPGTPPAEPTPPPPTMPGQPPAGDLLTVDQLLASKDRYLGVRVKLKGAVGPVMVHHKSLMLKSEKGMVEVLFANLPDPKLIQKLTSTTLDKPITVTGVVNLAPNQGAGARFQVNAEAVEF